MVGHYDVRLLQFGLNIKREPHVIVYRQQKKARKRAFLNLHCGSFMRRSVEAMGADAALGQADGSHYCFDRSELQ